MSEDRSRAVDIDPGATGVRWFYLYEKMTLATGALAYPSKWDGSDWVANTSATRVRVWASPVSLVGEATDFVACVYMARSRRWEMIGRWEDWGWARLSANLDALGSCTARVWIDSSISNTMTDTGVDITVHDRLLMTGFALPTLMRVRWEYSPRTAKRYVVGAACDVDTSSTIWGT